MLDEIKQTVIFALEPLTAARGGIVRHIAECQGKPEVKEIVKQPLYLPMIILFFSGSSYKSMGYPALIEEVKLHVYVCVKNERTLQAVMPVINNPPVYSPYAVLGDIRGILHGKDLGLNIMPFRLLKEGQGETGNGAGIFEAEYIFGKMIL